MRSLASKLSPWLRRAPHLGRANLSSGEPALERHRWTLDYPEDLAFFRAIFAALPQGSHGLMRDVLALIAQRPAITDLNACRQTTSDLSQRAT